MKHNKTRKHKKGRKYSQKSGSGSKTVLSKAKSVPKLAKDLLNTVGEELVKDSIKKTAENAIKSKQLLLQSPALIRTLQKNSSTPTMSVFSKLAKIADPNQILANESIKENSTSFISPDKSKRRSNTNTTAKKSRPRPNQGVVSRIMELSTVRKGPDELFSSPKSK